MTNKTEIIEAIIGSGGNLSLPVDIAKKRIVGLLIPSAWTAASLTFQGSIKGYPQFNDIYSQDGAEYTVNAIAGKFISFGVSIAYDAGDFGMFSSISKLRIRSGTAESPVAQTAEQIVGLVVQSNEE